MGRGEGSKREREKGKRKGKERREGKLEILDSDKPIRAAKNMNL